MYLSMKDSCAHVHTYRLTFTRMHAHTHTHTHTQIYAHANKHGSKVYKHTCIHQMIMEALLYIQCCVHLKFTSWHNSYMSNASHTHTHSHTIRGSSCPPPPQPWFGEVGNVWKWFSYPILVIFTHISFLTKWRKKRCQSLPTPPRLSSFVFKHNTFF